MKFFHDLDLRLAVDKLCRGLKTFSAILLTGVAALTVRADEIRLAENGRALAEIVIADEAVNAARFGAVELAAHLKAVTGAEFPVVTDSARHAGVYPICVGAGVEAAKAGAFAFDRQQYAVSVTPERTVLLGVDDPATDAVKVVYTNGVVIAEAKGIPSRWRDHGSLNAVYDFLHAACGVRWLDSSDFGTVLPSRPALAVGTGLRKPQPFAFCRNTGAQPEEWSDNRRNPEQKYGLKDYQEVYYPLACSRGKMRAFLWNKQKDVWLLRVRAGGEKLGANHSFYWYYERFLEKGHRNFVAYHPEWFARYRRRKSEGRADAADGGNVFSEYDTARKPGQMCYSNPEFIAQAIRDVRDYFDAGGYTNTYCAISGAKPGHPVANWGKDTYCLEPMDNDAFCECPDCLKQYEPERKADRAQHSTYFFRFVNTVAREIRKSHPKCKISTLAYMSHEGLPTGFRLEDNVVVHFCWSGNRMPNATDLNAKQTALMRTWRAEYPKNPFGLWLYNGFPNESSQWYGYVNFPGFFARVFEQEFHLIRDLGMRECIYNCGMKDDFESYCCNRWLWDPSEPLATIKDDFFASYGAAEKPIRAFYDLVEDRFCSLEAWDDHRGHMNKHVAWYHLGDEPTMAKLAAYMKAAEAAPGLTPQQRARVTIWRKGIWDYMCHGKYTRADVPSGKEGVKILRTVWNGAHAEPFGPSQVEGRPFAMTPLEGAGKLSYVGGEKESVEKCFALTKPGDGEAGGWTTPVGKNPPCTNVLFRCDGSVEGLKRLRMTFSLGDSLRNRIDVTLVGWVGEKRVELCPAVVRDTRIGFEVPKGSYAGAITYDFDFAPGTVPAHLDAIGFIDRSLSHKWCITRFLKFQVAR